jgi:hypothetical protein
MRIVERHKFVMNFCTPYVDGVLDVETKVKWLLMAFCETDILFVLKKKAIKR